MSYNKTTPLPEGREVTIMWGLWYVLNSPGLLFIPVGIACRLSECGSLGTEFLRPCTFRVSNNPATQTEVRTHDDTSSIAISTAVFREEYAVLLWYCQVGWLCLWAPSPYPEKERDAPLRALIAEHGPPSLRCRSYNPSRGSCDV